MGDISINGAKILVQNDVLGVFLTETVVNTWIVMAVIALVCWWLGHDLKVHANSKRQHLAEYAVGFVTNLGRESRGPNWMQYVPMIASILLLSCLGSLSSLFTLYAPTGDLSTLLGWAAVVFVLITYYKIKKNGIGGYLKSYLSPIPVMAPMNVISEIATPVSMAFRHFGNIASGSVISALIYAALAAGSNALLGWLPGALGDILGAIPILQVGIPAILGLYFDLFTAVIQAYIFCMLTMMYIAGAAATD